MTNQRVRESVVIEGIERMANCAKSRARARVEHVFSVVKRLLGLTRCALSRLGQERNVIFRGDVTDHHFPCAQAPGDIRASAARKLRTADATGCQIGMFSH